MTPDEIERLNAKIGMFLAFSKKGLKGGSDYYHNSKDIDEAEKSLTRPEKKLYRDLIREVKQSNVKSESSHKAIAFGKLIDKLNPPN